MEILIPEVLTLFRTVVRDDITNWNRIRLLNNHSWRDCVGLSVNAKALNENRVNDEQSALPLIGVVVQDVLLMMKVRRGAHFLHTLIRDLTGGSNTRRLYDNRVNWIAF